MDSSPVTIAIFKKAAAVTTFAMTVSLQPFPTLCLGTRRIVGYSSFPGSYPSPFQAEGNVVLGFSSYRKVVHGECWWRRGEIIGQDILYTIWQLQIIFTFVKRVVITDFEVLVRDFINS